MSSGSKCSMLLHRLEDLLRWQLLWLFMLFLGQHILGFMTKTEACTLYSTRDCPLLFLIRVSVYDSSTDRKVGVGASMMKACLPPLADSLYMEELVVKLGAGLWFTAGGQHIPFGASPQDVWSELGRPCGIHDKQVDQMVIHSAPNPKPRTTLCGDYLYNYFTCCLDILFNGQSYKIKKFVLHTNYPGHADFNSYTKCNFVIHTSGYDDSLPQDANTSKSTVWEQVKEILGDSGRAVIQTRGSTANPFGSTFVYGYPNIAFEIMKNGYIATATLFQC